LVICFFLFSWSALAKDGDSGFEAGGYIRGGGGYADNGNLRQYTLGLPLQGFTLGNSIDTFSLLFLRYRTPSIEGTRWTIGYTPSYWSSRTDLAAPGEYRTAQAYIEYGGVSQDDLKVWIGRRLLRSDVYIVDTYYLDHGGYSPYTNNGFGLMNLDLGVGKLSAAFFQGSRYDTPTDNGNIPKRLVLELDKIDVGSGGSLRFLAGFYSKVARTTAPGASLSAQYDQQNFPLSGMTNSIVFQRSNNCASLDLSFGPSGSSLNCGKGFRIIDFVNWQHERWGGQAIAMYSQEKFKEQTDISGWSIGGRVSYDISNNLKIQAELGATARRNEGENLQMLRKATLALATGLEPGFWSRPELRLYISFFNWNDSARISNDFHGKSDISAGVQFETWWGSPM